MVCRGLDLFLDPVSQRFFSGVPVRCDVLSLCVVLYCGSEQRVHVTCPPIATMSNKNFMLLGSAQVALLSAATSVPPPAAGSAQAAAAVPTTRSAGADPTTLSANSLPTGWNSSPGSVYVPTGTSASSRSSRNSLNGGQIAGIVIGAIAGTVLLAAAVAAGVMRYKRHRSGWRKDDLNGLGPVGPNLDAALGMSHMPGAPAGGAAAAAAESGMGHNGSALQYPHSPYGLRPGGGSAIEMQRPAGVNGVAGLDPHNTI